MRKLISFLMAVLLVVSLPLSALAAVTADVSYGNVTIGDILVDHYDSNGARQDAHGGSVTVVQGNGTANGSVTITAGSESNPVYLDVTISGVKDTTVTLRDANVGGEGSALEITNSDVTIELDGQNALDSMNKAGLQVNSDSSVTIQDGNADGGSLTAKGGSGGAGIGGNDGDSGDITITGGTVTAIGGNSAAGIGGGSGGDGSNIEITGGTVTATGGYNAAGIGGGSGGDGSDIKISGGTVTATGGLQNDGKYLFGAGIGGGFKGDGSNIEITGGTVTATGGSNSAGIGGGKEGGNGTGITITGGTVTATGGLAGAGIGGGYGGAGSDIEISGNATVEATGGDYGAGIGGGSTGDGSKISISGDAEVTATGGNNGAGIGGGTKGDGSKISISGDAEVTATSNKNGAGIGGGFKGNGSEISASENAKLTAKGDGYAADIGNGSSENSSVQQKDVVNINGLYSTGSITYRDGTVVTGRADLPAPDETSDISNTSCISDTSGGSTSGYNKGAVWKGGYIQRTLFKIENGAGMKPVWDEELMDGVLTITAENEPVVFTTWLNGLKELAKLGIETIVIKTADCETELVIEDLIAMNGNEYVLTQEGETAALTVDGEAVELG